MDGGWIVKAWAFWRGREKYRRGRAIGRAEGGVYQHVSWIMTQLILSFQFQHSSAQLSTWKCYKCRRRIVIWSCTVSSSISYCRLTWSQLSGANTLLTFQQAQLPSCESVRKSMKQTVSSRDPLFHRSACRTTRSGIRRPMTEGQTHDPRATTNPNTHERQPAEPHTPRLRPIHQLSQHRSPDIS